jgi:hypothetical protein
MSKGNKNYDLLDQMLNETQNRPGAGKVWVESKNHPESGYWADPQDANVSWESLKAVDDIEKYLRS